MQGLRQLFDTSDFPARWDCGSWTALHGWTHVAADLATFAAYFTIPLVIVLYVRRRPEVQFPTLFWLFAAFILSCGAVHLVEASIFWRPWYRLSGVVKVVTAVASWGAVFGLIHVFPRAMKLPGLAAMNAQLRAENEQRRRVEDELRLRNAELDKFVYVASHDLKAPIRSVGMLARWVEEEAGEGLPDDSREHLTTLRQRALRLERLLEDLLSYSRVGRHREEPEEVDLAELVRSTAEMATPAEFTVEVAEDLPRLLTPRAPLERVFLNLLGNAVKHHDRLDGRIRVDGRIGDDSVEICVEDDGPGIPAEYRERVFEIYQTLYPRDVREGSGMGLALVRKIAHAHGGGVRIEDVEDGERGARLVLTWPLRTELPVASGTDLQPA